MRSSTWKSTAELIGMAAIVGSLIFVGLQLRQEQLIAEAANLASRQDTIVEVVRLINENREVWIAGLNGDDLSEVDEVTFTALAETLYRHNETRFRVAGRLSSVESPLSRAKSYTYFVYQHPGLRRKIEEKMELRQIRNRAYGDPDVVFFLGIVNRRLSELDSASPEIPVKDYLIPGI